MFVTAQRDVDTFDRAREAGGDDFVIKPYRPSELVARVTAATKLRRMSAERSELYELIRQQRDDVMRLQLHKDQLIEFLVHDFKNPVHSIDLLGERISRDPAASERGKDAAAKIRMESRALMRMITNLLDLAKSDESRLHPQRERIELGPLFEEVAAEMRPRAQASEVTLAIAAHELVAVGDRDLVRRILENLVDNAIRHAPEGTRVAIAATRRGDGVQLCVCDAGPGVPAALREQVFDRFVQASGTARTGRGLGLAFCKVAVAAHGGKIMIEDGHGCRFCVGSPMADGWSSRAFEAAPRRLVADSEGMIVLVNQQTERMFGYRRHELIGLRIEILIPERFRPQHPAHVASYTGAPRARPMGSGLALAGRRRDGSEFPVEISLSPIASSGGQMVAASIRDVSDRKRVEDEARRANAYLRSAVDSIQDAFSLYDEEDRIVLVNSAFRQLLGSTGDAQLVGTRFEDLLDRALALIECGGDQAAVRATWLAYHRAPAGALELELRDGRALRMIDRPTAEHGTVSLIMDVSVDRLRSAELLRARKQAEAANDAKSEFLASMSHELRTPLNAVLGFAQLLQRDRKQPLSDRQQERVEHVVRGGEHLLRLIDDVLDLSRIEAGGVTISTEPVNVREVLDEVTTTLEPLAARVNVQLAIAPMPNVPTVVADRTRLAQILMNFGSNAIKYKPTRRHVTFRITRDDAMVRMSVADTGIGIPVDKRARIFEPFHRAGQESGPIEGTGIGLAITKRLAELMQGTVGFVSEAERGSTFWVEVPIDPAGGLALVRGRVAAEHSPLAAMEGRRKVVYVEDNPSNIAFMRELLEDLATVELLVAPTAEIGLDLIRAHLPAVVIMDINLPGISGFDAVRLLKDSPETRAIPVIALSAAALAKDTTRARDAGFHRYLTKPVKIDELTAVLEELLA